MVSQQSLNHKIGDAFEDDVLDNVKGNCIVAAKVNENSGGHSTPDMVCVEKGAGDKDITRLIEAKFDSYVRPSQREELGKIAEDTPATSRIQIAHPDDRGRITVTSVGGNSQKEVQQNLADEFNSPKTDNQGSLRKKYMAEISGN